MNIGSSYLPCKRALGLDSLKSQAFTTKIPLSPIQGGAIKAAMFLNPFMSTFYM